MLLLDSDGQVLLRAGQTGQPMFPRSVSKPMQAAGMLEAGLDVGGKLLALAAASHSGEEFHVTGVREILASAGLTEAALRCPPALPLDEQAQQEFLRGGGVPDRVHMNCSGKHAAMLACCVAVGWPTDGYTGPEHPLQRALRQAVAGLAGEPAGITGVDSCGAPLFALSLTGVARALQALVSAPPGTPQRNVADAMRAYPDWTSGTRRPERDLMTAVPGLLVKSGAEGVQGFALADGRAGAFKIEDGAARPRDPLTVALLRWLGAAAGPGVDSAALDRVAHVPVMGGERVVGRVRVTLPS